MQTDFYITVPLSSPTLSSDICFLPCLSFLPCRLESRAHAPCTSPSAIAVGYNAAQAIFGGTAGVAGTLLFRTAGGASVGVYVSVLALVSAFAIRRHAWRQRRKEDDAAAP
jgi:hypothetical protein